MSTFPATPVDNFEIHRGHVAVAARALKVSCNHLCLVLKGQRKSTSLLQRYNALVNEGIPSTPRKAEPAKAEAIATLNVIKEWLKAEATKAQTTADGHANRYGTFVANYEAEAFAFQRAEAYVTGILNHMEKDA